MHAHLRQLERPPALQDHLFTQEAGVVSSSIVALSQRHGTSSGHALTVLLVRGVPPVRGRQGGCDEKAR